MKIVCRKEFIVKSGDFILLKINPGDCLEISDTNKNEDLVLKGKYFYETVNKISFALDKDYFYTIEEWREQQLNKILDE